MLYFIIKNRLQVGTSKVSEAAGARWRFYRRMWSDYRRIVFLLAEAFRKFRLKCRRSIWWDWRMTWLAPRIGNDISYVLQITNDIDFVWQVQYFDFTGSTHWTWGFKWHAQYLVRLEGDLICSTHWKWAFICDADYRWYSFRVAGAVFGEVGG